MKRAVSNLLAATIIYVAGYDAWPSLPTSSLTITNLGARPGVKSVKTDSSEVRRDGKRIASITRVDRDNDGKFEEFWNWFCAWDIPNIMVSPAIRS
jgi:hypothetical protein